MVRTLRLMIIIIPALAPLSFILQDPALLAGRHQLARPPGMGRGGQLLAAREYNVTGFSPFAQGTSKS